MPAVSLVLAYLSAVTAAARHATAAGVLLFAAFTALVRYGYRRVRYWQQAPR